MNTDTIINELTARRDRITQAINALNGSGGTSNHSSRGRKRGTRLSAKARAKISLAAKRRWAEWRKEKKAAQAKGGK